MIRIAVCDDSAFMRNKTREQLAKYSVQRGVELEIDEYEAGELLIEAEKADANGHDLIFIDYEFEDKGRNGIEIIAELRKFRKHTKVIFLSSYTQVVFQSFEVEPFRFLVKPLEEVQLFKAMDEFMDSIAESEVLSLQIAGERFLIKQEAILYVEGCGKYCIIHFSDGREPMECTETLASVESCLSPENFFRCHKSYLVHLGSVCSHSHTDVTLNNGEKILLSRTKYKQFGAALMDYLVHNKISRL